MFTHVCGPLLTPRSPLQRECLELWRSNNPAAGVTQQQIEQCVGTRLEQFDTLPNFFHQAFFEWRFGWTEFMAQIDACKGFDSMTLLDMSDLQVRRGRRSWEAS